MIHPVAVYVLKKYFSLEQAHNLRSVLLLAVVVKLFGFWEEVFKIIVGGLELVERIGTYNPAELCLHTGEVPLVFGKWRRAVELNHTVKVVVYHLLNRFVKISSVEHLIAFAVNLFTLLVHNVVEFEDVAARCKVVGLYLFLSTLNWFWKNAGLYRHIADCLEVVKDVIESVTCKES